MGRSGILSSDLVLRILSDTRHPKVIAKEHGINYNHVYNIRAGRTYAKITGINRGSRNETRIDHEEHDARSQVDGDVSIGFRKGEAY